MISRPHLRRFPRFSHSLQVKIWGKHPSAVRHGRTVELSEQGVRVATREPLAQGQALQIELYLCETDPFPIRFQGECRWSTPEIQEAVAGIDLRKSSPRSLSVLKDYLDSRELEPA